MKDISLKSFHQQVVQIKASRSLQIIYIDFEEKLSTACRIKLKSHFISW